MEKELEITPPAGYEIDKENSTFECIKFRRIKEKWRGSNDYFDGCFIREDSMIEDITGACNLPTNYNVFATKAQAESALAMARISQIMANDKRFGGAVTDKEWNNDKVKYTLIRRYNKIYQEDIHSYYTFLAFHTDEQRKLFLQENKDLVKDYLMIK